MSNKIILTTCSLNHIAQAQNLGDSIAKFAPGYRFIIGVVDKVRDRFPPGHFGTHEIIEVGDHRVGGLERTAAGQRRDEVEELQGANDREEDGDSQRGAGGAEQPGRCAAGAVWRCG